MQINISKSSMVKVTKGLCKPDKLLKIPCAVKNTNDVGDK